MGRLRPPRVRLAAEPACPARCRRGPGGGGVAGPLRRVRSAAAVRDGHHLVAVSAAPGRAGVRVRRPSAVGAVGAVPVDHRGRRRARVADVGLSWDGRGGLQETERRLPPVGEGLAEIQVPRDERGDRRRDHRFPGCSPHAAARQVRHSAFSTSAAPPPSPRRQVLRSLAYSLRDGAVIRGQAGHSPPRGAARKNLSSRWWNPSWWWKSASTSPATPPDAGDIPHVGTAPAPTSPHRRPPPNVTAALTVARRGGPADAQPTERAPIPGASASPIPPSLILNSSQGMGEGSRNGGCQQPDHAKTAY